MMRNQPPLREERLGEWKLSSYFPPVGCLIRLVVLCSFIAVERVSGEFGWGEGMT